MPAFVVGRYFVGVVPQLLDFGAEQGFPVLIGYVGYIGYIGYGEGFVGLGGFGECVSEEVAEIEDSGYPLLSPGEGEVVVGVDDDLCGKLRD